MENFDLQTLTTTEPMNKQTHFIWSDLEVGFGPCQNIMGQFFWSKDNELLFKLINNDLIKMVLEQYLDLDDSFNYTNMTLVEMMEFAKNNSNIEINHITEFNHLLNFLKENQKFVKINSMKEYVGHVNALLKALEIETNLFYYENVKETQAFFFKEGYDLLTEEETYQMIKEFYYG